MNRSSIAELGKRLNNMSCQIALPQVFVSAEFIADTRERILQIANDMETEDPLTSEMLLRLKNLLFPTHSTGQPTVNPVVLGELLFALRHYMGVSQNENVRNEWSYIHPKIISVSQKLYLDGHYKNAANDAFIELNDRVKDIYKEANPDADSIPDGVDLMNKTFKPSNPICELRDIKTDSGYNFQLGMQHMCAGSISAFRNPKSHSNNEELTAEEAMRRLMFVSSLMYAIDDAISSRSHEGKNC